MIRLYISSNSYIFKLLLCLVFLFSDVFLSYAYDVNNTYAKMYSTPFSWGDDFSSYNKEANYNFSVSPFASYDIIDQVNTIPKLTQNEHHGFYQDISSQSGIKLQFLNNTLNVTGFTGRITNFDGIYARAKNTVHNDIIASGNKINISNITVNSLLQGISNVTESRNNNIVFSDITTRNLKGIALYTLSGNTISENDKIMLKNVQLSGFFYGIEGSNSSPANVTNSEIYLEDIVSGSANSSAGDILNIYVTTVSNNKTDAVISGNKTAIYNTTESADKYIKSDYTGMSFNHNGALAKNNTFYIGYDPKSMQGKYANILSHNNQGGSVYGISSGLWHQDMSASFINNKLFIGGLKKSDGSYGVNIDKNVFGVKMAVNNAMVNSNYVYIGYNPKDNSLLHAYIKGNVYGSYGEKEFYGASIDVNLENNGVLIQGDQKIDGNIYGAYQSSNGSIKGNFVKIGELSSGKSSSPAMIGQSVYGAYSSGSGHVLNNAVELNAYNHSISIGSSVYGAFGIDKASNFSGNNVFINSRDKNNVSIKGSIYGAYYNGRINSMSGNSVSINGTVSANSIYGAYAESGTFSKNNVLINNNLADSEVTTSDSIYGVYLSGSGSVSDTSLQIFGNVNINSSAGKNIYGVYSHNASDIEGTRVLINSKGKISLINGDIYSVYSGQNNISSNKTLYNNNLSLVGNTVVFGSLYGAVSNSGGVLKNNTVTFGNAKDTTVVTLRNKDNVYAAYSLGAGASLFGNLIGIYDKTTINNENITLYGAYSSGSNSKLQNNRIVIGVLELTPEETPANKLMLHKANVSASRPSSVVINTKGIYGAYSSGADSTLTNNDVIIAARTTVTSSIYGAYSDAYSSTVDNNHVYVINDAKIKGSIYGAYGKGSSSVTNNTVSVGALPNDKGKIELEGAIYGGYSEQGEVRNNKVSLIGHNDFSKNDIYGGISGDSSKVSNNSLVLDKFRGKIKSLNNFSSITFGNTKDNVNVWIKDSSVINITGGKVTDLSSTKFTNIPDIVADVTDTLYKKDRMYLIRNDAGIKGADTAYNPDVEGRLRQGFLREYKYHLRNDGTSIQIILGDNTGDPVLPPAEDPENNTQVKPDKPAGELLTAELTPEAESFLAGRDALALMVKRGGDMVSSLNSNIIHPIEKDNLGKNYNIGTFIKTDGGFVEDKGKRTYLSVTRAAILTGLGANFNISNKAEIFLTGFFEGGYGDYNRIGAYEITRQGVKTKTGIYAEGHADYRGGGLSFRSDFKIKPEHTVYFDTSFRGGDINYTYHAKNYVNNKNINASYKSASVYYGTHAGLGYIYNLKDKYFFDVYTKYLFSYYDAGKNKGAVSLGDGEYIHFDDFYSHRTNTGLRVSFATPVNITPYVSLGYSYQADEDVRAYAYNKQIKGHETTLDLMGVLDLGFTYSKKFSKALLYLDLKTQGTAGDQNSGTISFDLRVDF